MKADLHVHSYHSGYNYDLPFLRSRDCYSLPEEVYRTAKARSMDVVTITDHDSIDGCLEFLDRHPDASDFIIGEEISCWTPAPHASIEVHLGAYGMTERAHREIQSLRGNVFDVIAYLREARIFFALNHLFHFYRDQLPLADYLALLDAVPALEVRNGAMLPAHNALIERLHAAPALDGKPRHAIVAGSDAHTLRRIGCTWTEAPGTTAAEFLTNLAAGQGRAHGQQGGTLPLATDIYGVIAEYWLSLIGLRRQELSVPRRLFGAAFSIASAPFQFIPLLVASISKSREARCIARYAELLAPENVGALLASSDEHAEASLPSRHGGAAEEPRAQRPAFLQHSGERAREIVPAWPGEPADLEGDPPSFIPSPRVRGEG